MELQTIDDVLEKIKYKIFLYKEVAEDVVTITDRKNHTFRINLSTNLMDYTGKYLFFGIAEQTVSDIDLTQYDLYAVMNMFIQRVHVNNLDTGMSPKNCWNYHSPTVNEQFAYGKR